MKRRPTRLGGSPPPDEPAVPLAELEAVPLLEELLRLAVERRSSDIHIEPKKDHVRVRYRVDGVLVDEEPLPYDIGPTLSSRVKVLGKMDIADRRLPQDGTFTWVARHGQQVAVRASTFPSVHGEKVVLRLLLGGEMISLDRLGMGSDQVDTMRQFCRLVGGLVIVTGPTGSGKTTTLYSCLAEVETQTRNVVTLEDPIEVRLPDITQGQILPRAGFDFARGLRAILRQDPDVILVGEMRDRETASTAVQASLTGHLVLSTLHTNSTIETITRLVDIGLEAYIVANAVAGLVAQRLVRKICRRCSTLADVPKDVARVVGFRLPKAGTWRRGGGCDACFGTGYQGRAGLYEVVEMNDDLRTLIKNREEPGVIKQHLRERQIPTLRRAGVALALKGITTVEEVVRVT